MTNMLPDDFATRYGPRALILGGSEGIGAAFAEGCAAAGLDLVLVARNAGPLEDAAAALRARHGIDVSTERLDLAAPDVAERASALLARIDPGLVIYNAGAVHGIGRFAEQPLEKALGLARLNCLGPLAIAHGAMNAMRARRRGGILIVSSMSGLGGSGYTAAYAASKAFEIVLCEGLHWEAQRDGIDVMCLVAGLTDTPAMARSGMRIDADTGFVAQTSEEVAMGALAALGTTPVHYAVGAEAAAAVRAAPVEQRVEASSRASMMLWGIEEDAPAA